MSTSSEVGKSLSEFPLKKLKISVIGSACLCMRSVFIFCFFLWFFFLSFFFFFR
jgi:hypothetical protein